MCRVDGAQKKRYDRQIIASLKAQKKGSAEALPSRLVLV